MRIYGEDNGQSWTSQVKVVVIGEASFFKLVAQSNGSWE